MDQECCVFSSRIKESLVTAWRWDIGFFVAFGVTPPANSHTLRPPPDYQVHIKSTAEKALADKIFMSCCKCFFALSRMMHPRCRSPPFYIKIPFFNIERTAFYA